jgi:predicted RNA methylase
LPRIKLSRRGSTAVSVDPAARDAATQEVVAEALRSGRQPLPAAARSGYVRTPDTLADQLCAWPHHDLRWLPAGARVLEPSAGDGSLVAAILRTNPGVTVTAVESNPVRAAVCAATMAGHGPAVTVHTTTFEQYATTAIRERTVVDAVVMNPPFAVAAQSDVWLEHLRTAWHLLRPGGRLVAVVPEGLAFRSSGTQADARAFVEHHGTHQPLPAAVFAEAGAEVAARVVRMTKPVAAGTEYLLAPDLSPQPVRVDRPRLTGAAAIGMPVQMLSGGWHRDDRVLRYHGRCLICGWLLWGFDDRQNSPLGPLGEFSVGFSLRASEYDMSGPTIGLCVACGNNSGDLYRRALHRAYQHWTRPEPQSGRPTLPLLTRDATGSAPRSSPDAATDPGRPPDVPLLAGAPPPPAAAARTAHPRVDADACLVAPIARIPGRRRPAPAAQHGNCSHSFRLEDTTVMHTYADLLPHPVRTRIRSGRGSVACLAIRWTRPATAPGWSATIGPWDGSMTRRAGGGYCGGQGLIEAIPVSVLLDALRGIASRYSAFAGAGDDSIPFMRIARNHDWLAELAPPPAPGRLSAQTRRRMDLALQRWSYQTDAALDVAQQRPPRRVYRHPGWTWMLSESWPGAARPGNSPERT